MRAASTTAGPNAASAPPPPASTPTNANCDAPVKTSIDITHACAALSPDGHGEHPEGDGVDADREPDPGRVAHDPVRRPVARGVDGGDGHPPQARAREPGISLPLPRVARPGCGMICQWTGSIAQSSATCRPTGGSRTSSWPSASASPPPRACGASARSSATASIRGYHADVDPAAVGRGFEVTVHVELTLKDRATVEAFEAGIAALDEVIECRRMFGVPDYVMRVAVADQDAYEAFYMTARRAARPRARELAVHDEDGQGERRAADRRLTRRRAT